MQKWLLCFSAFLSFVLCTTANAGVYGLVYTIHKTYISAVGETYRITVSCEKDARIPEDADLLVSEVVPGTVTNGETTDAQTEPTAPDMSSWEESSSEDHLVSSAYGLTYEDYVAKTEDALGMKTGSAGYIRLFDISIVKEGEKIQPAYGKDVEVQIELEDSASEELSVVHFSDGDEKASVIAAEVEGQTVSFEASGFSVYAVVETITTDYLSADGTSYHIEVNLDKREGLRGEAQLVVGELLDDAENYEHYLWAVSETMLLESPEELCFVRLFDIKILLNGEEYEPKYPVQMTITYDEALDLGEDQSVSVVHFADSGTEVIQAVDLSSDGRALTYQQDSFSVTATVVASTNIVDGHQYIIYTQNNGNFYAVTHYSEGRDSDLVYGAPISAVTAAGGSFTESDYGSSIVWTAHKVTVSGTAYYTFSYEESGKTYYLRSYGGLMVGTDSDINESSYKEESRYQWQIESNRLRARYTSDITRRLRYSNSANGFRERDNNSSSTFYFADVTNYTQDAPKTPVLHYVDENGNELTVENGRDWSADGTTSPAFLIYDIAGYEYVKTTLQEIGGTQIRPILRYFAGNWQYTASAEESTSIPWAIIPADQTDSNRLEDIYIVYKNSSEPVEGGSPKVKQVQDSQPPAEPTITKESTVNGDGTNTLALSVSGHTAPLEVEKLADVIVIFDTSTSMRRHMGTSTTTYESNATKVKDYTDHETRLWIAAEAVKDLAETLIGSGTQFKDSAGNKLIRMSLISFNRNANLEIGFTDDCTSYAEAVENLTTEAGTNWEAALNMANHMAVDAERATFVIFVTDGNPSYRTSRGNLLSLEGYPDLVDDSQLDVNVTKNYYFYRVLQYFGALDENDERNYNTAAIIAESIVDHKKNLYCIGIGNPAGITRLEGLTTQAYDGNADTGKERTKTAENPEELAQAFTDIAASIVALMGHSDVQISDGITDLTQTVQKSALVDFLEDDFTYWKRHDYDIADQADVDAGRAEAVGDKIITGSDWESWTPSSEGCAEAVYDPSTGAVLWHMGAGFLLQEGYTYQVRFKVWPSQEAYDLLADLNNGVKTYTELSEDVRAQISEPDTEDGMYTLKTNSETSYTYREAAKTGDEVTLTGDPCEPGHFEEVDPLKLTTKPLAIQKQWLHSYSSSSALPESITMELYGVDPDETNERTFKTITLTDSSAPTPWYDDSTYISFGLMTLNKENGASEETVNLKIYETGHDFTLRETGETARSYELTAGIYRPMVINGTETILERTDEPAAMSEGAQYYTDGTREYFRIDNKIYQSSQSDALLLAANSPRSHMDLAKIVVDESGTAAVDDTEFEYRISFTIPEDTEQAETYIWFSISDASGRMMDPSEYSHDGAVPLSSVDETAYGGPAYAHFLAAASEETLTLKIKAGWNVRFLNLPVGTAYSLEEVNIPENYSFVKAEVGGTRWISQVAHGEDQGSAVPMSGLPSNTGESTALTGTIDYANALYAVTYTNQTKTQEVRILKTSQDIGEPLKGALFSLYTQKGYEASPKEAAKTELRSDANGKIDLGRLAYGLYYLEETAAPSGYILPDTPVTITVNDDGVTYHQEGNCISQSNRGVTQNGSIYTLTVTNDAGVELPSTGGITPIPLYLCGILLVSTAGILLLLRRRAY